MTVTATGYLQVEGEVRAGKHVIGARIVGFTKNPPAKPQAGTLTVKLNLKFPEAAFLRLIPEADVEIPDAWFTTTPVVVVSLPPADDEIVHQDLGS